MSLKSNGYRNPEAYRIVRERAKRKYRMRTNSGMWYTAWTEEAYVRVMEHNIPDRELSEEIEHSVGSIQIMRNKLRHLEDYNWFRNKYPELF